MMIVYMNIKVELNILKFLIAKRKIMLSPSNLIWLFEKQRCKILNRCALWLGNICEFGYEGVKCFFLFCLCKDYFSDQLNPC